MSKDIAVQNLTIQYVIKGKEIISIIPREMLTVTEAYVPEKDITFYENSFEGIDHVLSDGDFLIIAPADSICRAYAPMRRARSEKPYSKFRSKNKNSTSHRDGSPAQNEPHQPRGRFSGSKRATEPSPWSVISSRNIHPQTYHCYKLHILVPSDRYRFLPHTGADFDVPVVFLRSLR